jgi:hypothetical protein
MSAALILDRLEAVKRTGPNSWLAKCAAHPDRRPSLSVREVEGRVLLHCFAGCEVEAILAALDLDMADLFAQPLGHHYPPSHSRIPARDLLEILSEEVSVAYDVTSQIRAGRTVSAEDWERFGKAVDRIHAARDHGRG